MTLTRRSPADLDDALRDIRRDLDESRRRSAGLALAPLRSRSRASEVAARAAAATAADNLVDKAIRALRAGDPTGAEQRLHRALLLAPDSDDVEDALPASAATVRRFVADCRIAASESARNDESWLDRMLSQLEALDPAVRDGAAEAFDDLDQSVLTGREIERLELAPDVMAGIRDPLHSVEPASRTAILVGVLRLAIAAGSA